MIRNSIEEMIQEATDFNKQQVMEAFYWMILGDGCIEQTKRGNYKLSITHATKHRDYLVWKSAIIGTVTSSSIHKQTQGITGFNPGGVYYRLRSSAHPWFTKVWDRIYGQIGRKCLDPMAISLLGPLGLAILYQDDGSLHYSPAAGTNVLIHKLCFSKFELEALAKDIVDKFGIIFRINRTKGKGFGYRLRLRASDFEKFVDLISPYVVPSMEYKIVRGGKH